MHRIKYVHKTATNQMPMQAKAGRSTALSVGSLSALGGVIDTRRSCGPCCGGEGLRIGIYYLVLCPYCVFYIV